MIALLLVLAMGFLVVAVWQGARRTGRAGLTCTAAIAVVGVLLVVYGAFFGQTVVVRPRHAVELFLEPLVVPVFVLLPASVAFCVVRGLLHRAWSVRGARVAAGVAGAAVWCVTPFGAIVAGCGLAGLCF